MPFGFHRRSSSQPRSGLNARADQITKDNSTIGDGWVLVDTYADPLGMLEAQRSTPENAESCFVPGIAYMRQRPPLVQDLRSDYLGWRNHSNPSSLEDSIVSLGTPSNFRQIQSTLPVPSQPEQSFAARAQLEGACTRCQKGERTRMARTGTAAENSYFEENSGGVPGVDGLPAVVKQYLTRLGDASIYAERISEQCDGDTCHQLDAELVRALQDAENLRRICQAQGYDPDAARMQ